jgi:hypothetical protein
VPLLLKQKSLVSLVQTSRLARSPPIQQPPQVVQLVTAANDITRTDQNRVKVTIFLILIVLIVGFLRGVCE